MNGELTISVQWILNGLWELLTAPRNGVGLTKPRRDALKLLLSCRGGEEFITTRPESEIAGLLYRLWEFAHANPVKATRKNVIERAWATHVAFLLMRGSCCAHRTEDEQFFYWREGHWPVEGPFRFEPAIE